VLRRQNDWVRIQTGLRVIELSWTTAQELKGRLLASGAETLVNQFQRVGTSRPVVLDHVDRQPLLDAVLAWIGPDGEERVPERVVALRNALLTEHTNNP